MAAPFANEPIPVDQLPQLSGEAFVPVDPRYLRASFTGFAVVALIVVAGGTVWMTQATGSIAPLLITTGILVLVCAVATLRILEIRRLAYQVREHDLSMRSGVVTHRVESLPFARIQHVSIHRGPIDRTLGLATLAVSSAGPDITIPGLARDDAERIKLFVTERSGVSDDADFTVDADPSAEPTLLTDAPAPLPPPTA